MQNIIKPGLWRAVAPKYNKDNPMNYVVVIGSNTRTVTFLPLHATDKPAHKLPTADFKAQYFHVALSDIRD